MINKEYVIQNADNKEFILKAIDEDATLIEFASDEIRDNKEIMLEAIKRNGKQIRKLYLQQ